MELKYKFNTLEEVKTAVEKWFKNCGYDGPEKADKQYLKIIAEVGEMCDELAKENFEKFKSEAGDVFVTIIGYCLKKGLDVKFDFIKDIREVDLIKMVKWLNSNIYEEDFDFAIDWLDDICFNQDTTLLECATIAYNKIQGRLERGELSVVNGTVVKSGK